MKRIIFILIILQYFFISNAQHDTLVEQAPELKYDTSRIADVSEKLAVYAGISGKIHTIELSDQITGKKLSFQPNGKTSIGLGFGYKWLGLGLSFSPGFMNKDDDIYGKTESFDTQLNIYSRFFGVDAYLLYYKGFYLKNPTDFTNWQNDFFPQKNDLESFSFGLAAYYFSNHKRFSYKAAFTRNQIQKRSAGAFIAGVFINANVAASPGGFLPAELPDSLQKYFPIEAIITYSTGISLGYTHTFVFLKRFFINLSLVPGFAYRHARYQRGGEEVELTPVVTASLTSRLSIGYEGKRLYAGFALVSLIDSYTYETIDISSSTGNIRFFVGKRFDLSKLKRKHK